MMESESNTVHGLHLFIEKQNEEIERLKSEKEKLVIQAAGEILALKKSHWEANQGKTHWEGCWRDHYRCAMNLIEGRERVVKGQCIAFDEQGKEVAWVVQGHPEWVITTIKGH